MIRRDPTRIELKLDDIQEFDRLKQDQEAQKLKDGLLTASGQAKEADDAEKKRIRIELIHSRIGLNPGLKAINSMMAASNSTPP